MAGDGSADRVPAGKSGGISLKTRIVLILLVMVLIHTVLDYGVQRFVLMPSFIDLERRGACDDMHRCLRVIDSEVRHLETLCVDWATWDDTYAFVADKNAEYITSNLKPSTFSDDKISVLYICNTAGRVVWGQCRGLKVDRAELIDIREFPAAALPPEHPLLLNGAGAGISGVYLTQRGPMLVVARPIITSDGRGPARGTLIMGRLLDQQFVDALCHQTRITFKLTPIPGGSFDEEVPEISAKCDPNAPCCTIRVHSEDVLHGYAVLGDLEGKPALLMQADIPREISLVGRDSAWFTTIWTSSPAVSVCLAFESDCDILAADSELTRRRAGELELPPPHRLTWSNHRLVGRRNMRITVLLADDHEIVRGGLRSLLEQESDMDVVADVGDGQGAIDLARKLHPSVVVMDISMPGLNGTVAAKRVLSESPGVKVLALSAHTDRRFVSDMLKAGATGYLPKSCAPEELVKAIREVHAGGIYLSPKIAGVVVEGFVQAEPLGDEVAGVRLSDREREVLQLIAEGRSSKEIGVAFHISARTVDTHRQRLMDKLGIHTVAELTKFAVREGLTGLED